MHQVHQFIENENDRLELQFLRKKLPKLEKDFKEGSTQNIPELKHYFSSFEPTVEVRIFLVVYKKIHTWYKCNFYVIGVR